ncbi:methylamine utilization protein [Planctobacterium marinum]|uniref:Methylamine utilization protein n=1 Tax=Planctobacterium marinum TaxID=1631968 RepID=A0AA48KPV0_9ALTE|nr:hypothetical protein MACH26_25720 [Planctobacterium marinum]
MKRGYLLLKLLCIFSLVVQAAIASEVTVVDQEGNPVPDVVFTWPSDKPTQAQAQPVVVDQIDRQFVPHVTAIVAGQDVDFPNSDNIRHHVYSFSESNPFEIKLYRNRPVAPINFARPGVVALGCNIHDQMIGYIYVAEPNSAMALTDKNGVVQLPDTGAVSYWHPRMSQTGSKTESLTMSGDENRLLTLSLLPVLQKENTSTFGSGTFGSE